MIFEMSEEGAFHVSGLLDFGATKGRDTAVVMERIVADMMRVERQTFYAQGRRGGGSWKPLLPDTVRKKGVGYQNILRTDLANPGYSKIGGAQSVDTLFKSLTQPGARYQILDVTNSTILFGTERPYAGAHQHGSWMRFIPARPFMTFLPTDEERWTRMMSEHLMAPFMTGEKE